MHLNNLNNKSSTSLGFDKLIFRQPSNLQFFVPHSYPKRLCVIHSCFPEQTQARQVNGSFIHRLKKSANTKLTSGVKLLGILGVSLPLQSLMPSASSSDSTLDKVLASKTLHIATVSDTSTYFSQDGFVHGFGYDVSRSYANHLNVHIKITTFHSEALALNAVATGAVDMALTNAKPSYQTGLTNISLSCEQDFLAKVGLNQQVSWQVRQDDKNLSQNAAAFVCDNQQLAVSQQLASFYNQNILKNKYSEQHFIRTMNQTLPIYKTSFQQNAQNYNLDWELLVAIGYQESHLQADATSPTGVRGIMMLTNDTAKAMGVSDRIDPVQSIEGGAKYLEILRKQFADIPNPDRLWFSLASYNMGPTAVKAIQAELNAQGRNGNSWAEVYNYMAENSYRNSRYVQCMDYVTNIRGYLETLKSNSLNLKVA